MLMARLLYNWLAIFVHLLCPLWWYHHFILSSESFGRTLLLVNIVWKVSLLVSKCLTLWCARHFILKRSLMVQPRMHCWYVFLLRGFRHTVSETKCTRFRYKIFVSQTRRWKSYFLVKYVRQTIKWQYFFNPLSV